MIETLQVTPVYQLSIVLDGKNTSHLTLTSPRGVFYHYQLRHAGLPLNKLYPQCLFYVDLDNDDRVPDEWMEQFRSVIDKLEELLRIQPIEHFLVKWEELRRNEWKPKQNGDGE